MKVMMSKICLVIAIAIGVNGISMAQPGECWWGGCFVSSFQFPSGPALSTTSTTFSPISTSMPTGAFALCNVVSGTTYDWSMCSSDGGLVWYDAVLTLFDASNNMELCYSDDVCGFDPKITWTATFTGTVKIQLNEYGCWTNSDLSTLVWRVGSTTTNPTGGECDWGGCSFLNVQYPPGPPLNATAGTFSTIAVDMYAGEFALCNVTSGTTYEWSLCPSDGAFAPYDAQLTLFNGTTNAEICYSDDYCGMNPKISWTATYTGTVKIQVNEYFCNTNMDETHLRWRAVGGSTNVTDAAVANVYSLGKIAIPNSNPQVVTARVTNTGTTLISSLPVTLTVYGANSFINTQTITNLPVGMEAIVTFVGFNSINSGINFIEVSVPMDDNIGNNLLGIIQEVTTNSVSYTVGSNMDIWGGFNGSSGEVAVKFYTSIPTSVNQVKTTFASSGANYRIKIYDATGVGGTPGNLLHASPITPTSFGVSSITLSPSVNVNGNFYVSAEEVGFQDYGLGFQLEMPVRPNTFYLASPPGTGWWDFAFDEIDFKPMIEVEFICVPPANLSAISGPGNVCAGQVVTYQVPAAAGVGAYNWVLPPGWSGSSSTNTITVMAGSNSGNVSVYGTNACGTTQTVNFSVSSTPTPAQPAAINGSTTVCQGSAATYSVPMVSGATSYNWILPTGWTGNSTINTINVVAGANPGTISVNASNGSCSGPAQNMAVSVGQVPVASVSGPGSVCEKSTHVYSMTPVSGVLNYIWSLPPGWSGSSSTNTITVTAGTTGGNVSLIVTNNCGNSAPGNLNVTVNQANIPVVALNNGVLTSTQAASYQWSMNGTDIPGAISQNYTPLTSGIYAVTITDANGCTAISNPFNFNYVSVAKAQNEKDLVIYPNPASNMASIKLKGVKTIEPVTITNILGVSVKEIPAEMFDNNSTYTFEISGFSPGVYFVNAKVDGFVIVKKFVIQK